MTIPRFDQLPISGRFPAKSAWGLWGDDDECGALNKLSPERVVAAAGLVRKGAVFPLNWALTQPNPPLWGREPVRHHVTQMYDGIQDDSLDHLFLQASSHWDSLSHVAHPEHGYYNGRSVEAVSGGETSLNGIDKWATRGLAGRGVLVDMPRHWVREGRRLDGGSRTEFTPSDLESACEAQQVDVRPGDVLIVRSGWMTWYLSCSAETRREIGENSLNALSSPGLCSDDEMAAWLWDKNIVAVAADNPGVEAWPHSVTAEDYLHFKVLPLLGIGLGELWFLEDLADDCAADGVYEFLLTSAPLNLPGGTGSPANALAIK